MVYALLAQERYAVILTNFYNHILKYYGVAQVIEGRDNVKLAVHGLGEPQLEAGYVCTCQCYPTGPGVVIKLDAFEEVYESQYGQFELSYGDLKYGTKKEEIKKNFFGL